MPPHTSAARRFLTAAALSAAAVAAASPVLAQGGHGGKVTQAGTPGRKSGGVRLGAPPAAYIVERANAADLDEKRGVTYEHEGKKIRFTPARVTDNLEEAGQGHVIGILETEVEGGETGLPPGRYTIFAKSVGGEWEAFAEANGTVVKQALDVTAADVEEGKPGKPKFDLSDAGWCWTTGPYPAPTEWGRYEHRGYWHYYPTAWGRHQTLTVCW
jgi:hypothetical protein